MNMKFMRGNYSISIFNTRLWCLSISHFIRFSVPVRQWPITLLPTAECYDMTHGNQGKVIIFNHKEYIDGTDKREGTEKDVKRIENTFRNLDFDVIIHTDLMLADIQDVLDGCMFI